MSLVSQYSPAALVCCFSRRRVPPCFIHVGEVDPLVDDSVLFARRLRLAAPDRPVKLHIIPGISHAYMHMSVILPEGKQAIQLSIEWLRELLNEPSEASHA